MFQVLSKLDIQTRITQNYWSAERVDANSDVQVISTAAGRTHFVALSHDNRIWVCMPKDNTETGNQLEQTELSSIVAALNTGLQDELLIFGARVNFLQVIREEAHGLSAPVEFTLAPPVNTSRIARIFTRKIDRNMYIGILYQYGEEERYAFSFCIWDMLSPNPPFINTNLTTDTLECAWWGETEDDLVFVTITDDTLVSYDINTFKINYAAIATGPKVKKLDTTVAGNGDKVLYALLDDGKLYRLRQENDRLFWNPLLNEVDPRCFDNFKVAYVGEHLHVFASANRILYHLENRDENMTSAFLPIARNLTAFSLDKCNKHELNLVLMKECAPADDSVNFGFVATNNGIEHIRYNSDSEQWDSGSIMVKSANQKIYEYNAYASEITFFTEEGNPCPGLNLELWTPEYKELSVNDRIYKVSPDHKITAQTDMMGKLHIVQSATSLNSADIVFKIAGANDDNHYVIKQNEKHKERLSNITAQSLLEARKDDGSYLIVQEYRQEQVLNHVADAMHRVLNASLPDRKMQISNSLIAHNSPLDICCYNSDPTMMLNRIPNPRAIGSFEIVFTDNDVLFRTLSAEEYNNACLEAENGFFSFFKDMFRAIADGIVKVTKIVVNAVEEAVNATIHFVEDAVAKIGNFVIKTVQEVVNLAESIFTAIKTFFVDIVHWLGILFNWQDILKTQEFLAQALNDTFRRMSVVMKENRGKVQARFKTAEKEVQDAFATIKAKLDPSINIRQGPEERSPDDPYLVGSSNNIVHSKLMANGNQTGLIDDGQLENINMDILDRLLLKMQEVTSSTGTSLQKAQDYFEKAIANELILQNILCGMVEMVEALVEAVLSATEAVVLTIIDGIEELLSLLSICLNTKIKIPFLSELFYSLCHQEMTILNVGTLLLAVPITVIYKIISGGQAPFAIELSRDRQSNSVSAKAAYIISAVCAGIFYVLGAVLECFEVYEISKLLFGILAFSTIAAGSLWLGFSTDLSAAASSEAALGVLIVGILCLAVDAGLYIARFFDRPLPVGPEEMDSSEESQDFDVDKYKYISAILDGIMGVVSICVGTWYFIEELINPKPKSDLTKAFVVIGSVVPGLASTCKFGNLAEKTKPNLCFGLRAVSYICGAAVTVVYAVMAVKEPKPQPALQGDMPYVFA